MKKPDADKDLPVFLYASKFNRPYAVDYFGLKPNIMVQLDGELTMKLNTIDSFVLEQIAKDNLAPSKESYKEIVSKIEKVLGIDPNLNSKEKVTRLFGIISMYRMVHSKQSKPVALLKKLFK